MNYFKPIDEISLRVLFASPTAQGFFEIETLGPVLGPSGKVESSPDALCLDKRGGKLAIKRVEFKLVVKNVSDFKENGKFDIAVCWDSLVSLPKLEEELWQKHGCKEVIVVNNHKLFRELPDYNEENIRSCTVGTQITRILERRNLEAILAAYFAVKKAPREFSTEELLQFLRTQGIQESLERTGLSIIQKSITSLTYAQLFEKNRKHYYRWSPYLNPAHAIPAITKMLLKARDTLPVMQI